MQLADTGNKNIISNKIQVSVQQEVHFCTHTILSHAAAQNVQKL